MTAAEPSGAVPGPDSHRVLRLATRGSALALAQSRLVVDGLRAAWPALRIELVTVVTEGDRRRDVPAAALGGKGIFTAAVQQAVLDGRADLAVHCPPPRSPASSWRRCPSATTRATWSSAGTA
jgi:Porphobilinogen deaminase, dipyromethane cofactor binding domain